ncbi:hypothetical protein L915_00605 [Phytophthora nicotianae]|uniref:RxLR effector protein n=1 Tax=Phytophthora nicotianae TaxID=4792 RepID=W2HNK9_PHYNI|nr:hypothetical protein L915_00605 [Phytophthora nicotianae]
MRLLSVVLLLSTVFLTRIESSSENTNREWFTNSLSAIDKQGNTPAQRFLRKYEVGAGTDEERVGLGNVVNAIKTAASKIAEDTKLRTFLLMKNKGVDVLNSLKFGDDVAVALKSSKMNTLKKYIAMFNEKYPDNTISLIGVFTARYGDDAVAKALVSAERHADSAPDVAELAKKLRAEQTSAWLEGGKSVVDVFNSLKLQDDEFVALVSRKLEVLDDYIVKFNSEKNGHETLLRALTTGFGGDDDFRLILTKAKHVPATRAKAIELENLRRWQQEQLEPKRVMKLLSLGDDVENALKSIKLRRLDEYIIEFNRMNPSKQQTLLGVLTKQYGEAGVAKAIVSAVKEENMLAVRLQKQQLEGWLHSEKSVDDVFKLLEFKKNDLSSIVSRRVETLDKYIMLYNREKSAKETLVGVFVKAFGETQLKNMLERIPATNERSEKLRRQFIEWKPLSSG